MDVVFIVAMTFIHPLNINWWDSNTQPLNDSIFLEVQHAIHCATEPHILLTPPVTKKICSPTGSVKSKTKLILVVSGIYHPVLFGMVCLSPNGYTKVKCKFACHILATCAVINLGVSWLINGVVSDRCKDLYRRLVSEQPFL